MGLHVLNLFITHRLIRDIETFSQRVQVLIPPAACPLEVSPFDFSATGELMDEAARRTSAWLTQDGLEGGDDPILTVTHGH